MDYSLETTLELLATYLEEHGSSDSTINYALKN